MVSADVCGRESFTSSASDSPESDSTPLFSAERFSDASPLLSLSGSLDSDERIELPTLFAFPTAETRSHGAVNENARLLRNPRSRFDSGASFSGWGFERVAAGRGGS